VNTYSEEAIDEDRIAIAIGWTISDEAETELLDLGSENRLERSEQEATGNAECPSARRAKRGVQYSIRMRRHSLARVKLESTTMATAGIAGVTWEGGSVLDMAMAHVHGRRVSPRLC
jgi:hypothetical protein